MAQKPKQKSVKGSFKEKLQNHLKAFEQNYGSNAVKWYKSFLAASLAVIGLAIFYFTGSLINWWIVFVIAGIAGLSILFKTMFWGDDNW